MEIITIEIKRKHFLNSEGYLSNYKCPLALAAQEYFKDKDITVGGFYFSSKNKENYLTFDEDIWNDILVDAKIEEAQKCLKSKKKFNSVFLKLIKQ